MHIAIVFPPSNHMLISSSKYLVELEQRSGTKLTPGHDPKIEPIRATLDPVRTAHKPSIWYLVSIYFSDQEKRRTTHNPLGSLSLL